MTIIVDAERNTLIVTEAGKASGTVITETVVTGTAITATAIAVATGGIIMAVAIGTRMANISSAPAV